MDVRMPDGSVIKNVPEGTTKRELQERLSRAAQPDPQPAPDVQPQGGFLPESFGQSFGRAALEKFLGNLGSLPAVVGNPVINALSPAPMADHQIVPDPVQAISAGIRGLTGGRVDPTTSAERVREAGGMIPRVSGTDIMAAGQTAAQLPGAVAEGQPLNIGGRFSEAQEAQQQATQQASEQQPFATAAGGVAGDVGTMLLAGGPARAGLRAFESRRAVLPKSTLPPGLKRQLDDLVRSKFGRTLERVGLRAGEAGLEGATLAVLNDSDPVKTAAFAAGGQAVGSAALGLNRVLLGKGISDTLVRSGGAFLTLTALLQIAKEKIPGGRDRILESFETSGAALATIAALGATATLAGMGRQGGRFAENMPRIADAMTAIPRNALLSGLKDIFKASDENELESMEAVISTLAENPEAFGKATARRIERAFRNGRFKAEIDKLMKNKKFRERLDELNRVYPLDTSKG